MLYYLLTFLILRTSLLPTALCVRFVVLTDAVTRLAWQQHQANVNAAAEAAALRAMHEESARVEDDASTISQTPTTHYTNTCVKLTIVTHLSFSERIAIANLSYYIILYTQKYYYDRLGTSRISCSYYVRHALL